MMGLDYLGFSIQNQMLEHRHQVWCGLHCHRNNHNQFPRIPYGAITVSQHDVTCILTLVYNDRLILRPFLRLSKSSRQSSASSSHEDVELPKELTEDWSTMEVCVDCKRFISDIISSSKHSLSLATKRGRMKRKTHSFITPSASGSEYQPSERTIHEV